MIKQLLFFSLLFMFASISNAQTFYSQENILGIIGAFGNHSGPGGTGVSFVDFNQDGYDDLTMASANGTDVYFFENKGDHFESISLLTNLNEGRQVLWVDFDNDGDKDFFYATENAGIFLYENDGNLVFTDVTSTYELPTNMPGTRGASFGDFNNDGFLDLYLSNYNNNNALFSFDGNVYTDQTIASETGNGIRPTFCATLFDFDLDGLLDIYVVNDKDEHPNALYQNQGNFSFLDISVASGTDLGIDAMNGGVGDFNNDGYQDIYVTDEMVASLLSNQGDSTFIDLASSTNTTFDRLGWGGNFFDFDNDEDIDLYVSTSWKDTDYPSALYVNTSNVYTEPLFTLGGISGSDTLGSFCNVIGDINNDGRLDIATGGTGVRPFRLFVNYENNVNDFVKLELKGTNANFDAYGAEVEVYSNNEVRKFQKFCANGFTGQNSDILTIGILNGNSIDSIIIKWPFTQSEDLILGADLTINKLNIITEGSAIITNKALDICLEDHEVILDPVVSQIYGGNSSIDCSVSLDINSNITFKSNNEIFLKPGFIVPVGSILTIIIENCSN